MASPFPRAPEQVTPHWLETVLRAAGAAVSGTRAAVEATCVGTGQMGTCIRYALSWDVADPNAPASVICKFPSADPRSRATGLAMRTYEVEVGFYRYLARTVDIRTPVCHFADIDPTTGDFVLVLEDLAPAAPGDQLTGCTVEQAAIAMEELAKLHAPRWNDTRLAAVPWLNRNTPDAIELAARLLSGLLPVFLDRYGTRLTADETDIAERLLSAVGAWLRDREPPFVIQHGDYRVDNMLFGTAEGGPSLAVVDWQTAVWGPPVADASYFLGASLPTAARRANERALLGVYRDALAARGVSFDRERLWRDYRRYAFSGFLMAVGASVMVVQTARGDEMFLTMARRHAAHILDLEALALLGR